MTLSIKAHFDGRVIVPDEPVDLPLNTPLELRLIAPAATDGRNGIEERLRRLERSSGIIGAPAPSAESLRRENLYDEQL